MAKNTESKWEGKLTRELKGIKAEQVWPFLEDFCNVHKWFPFIATSDQVEGEMGKPGLIRYCESVPQVSYFDVSSNEIRWAKERLIMINPIERCMSYEIMENNMNIKSYVATWKVLPLDGGDEGEGCSLEWGFAIDPVEGMTLEDYESFRSSCFELVIKNFQTLISV